jgi:hypothetical protein
MAQPKKREICYEYYTSRDWIQVLGRGRQPLLTPDPHPPQDASWWRHLSGLFGKKSGFRVTIPLSKYRLEQNSQRIIICVEAIPEDSWQQFYQSSRDEVLRTTITSAKTVKSTKWVNSSVFIYALMLIVALVIGFIRFELLK